MNADREARRQQRLRGAQRHQVADVDFGLSFPIFPAASQQSNREATPDQADPIPQLPSNRTPIARNSPAKRKTPGGFTDGEDEAESIKRRRLDEQIPSSSSRQSRRDIYELEDEEPEQVPLPESDAANLEEEEVENAAGIESVDADGHEESNQDVGENSTGWSGILRNVLSSSHDTQSPIAQQLQADPSPAKNRRVLQLKPTPRVSQHTPITQPNEQDEMEEMDELSPEQISPLEFGSLQRPREQFSDDEGEEAEEINDLEAAKYMEKHRRRDVHDEESLEMDELEASENPSGISITPKSSSQVEAVRKAGRPKKSSKASPSAQRHPKPKPRKSKGAGDGIKKSRGEPIPVTVYRLTKAPTYDEEADEADILMSNVPYFKRAGANAVDVLSQITEEFIETGLSSFEDAISGADPRTKKELRVKLRALKHYQQEMRPRLLELSSNLDHGYSLTRRIRLAQKQRVDLREEVMQIRSEREKIALRMDEIRMKQEEDNKHFLARNEINNALHDIENAVERGKAMPDIDDDSSNQTDTAGLEMLLKSIAAEVSNASDEGGVLKQVQEFNAFLERAALALEGRV